MNSFVSHPLIKPNTIEKREYQENLVEKIISKGNTLVVAPTALGKTIIAILLSANLFKKGKILFLAPTKPLAKQHYSSFIKFMNLKEENFLLLTGEQKKNRKELFQKAKIICATPQTIEKMLLKGEINLKDFALVIFDEAHRAVGSYSYVYIAKTLYSQNPNCLILALTASPGNTEEKIKAVCNNLYISNIEIKSYSDSDVKPYIKDIDIEWVYVSLPKETKKVKELLASFVSEQIERLASITKLPLKFFQRKKNLLDYQNRLIKERNKHPASYTILSILASVIKLEHAIALLETQGLNPFLKYIEKLKKDKTKAAKRVFQSEKVKQALSLLDSSKTKAEHPKLEALRKIILSQIKKNKNSKIIVFCNYRDSIENIVSFLKEKNISAREFIGQAKKGAKKGLSQKEQSKILSDFRKGEFDVLVASSVAEEGLDIPSVDLVVFYEPVPSEIRTIQRRGRTGRLSSGKTIILITKKTRDEYFYYSSRSKESKMKSTLKKLQSSALYQTKLSSYRKKSPDIIIYMDSREQNLFIKEHLISKGAVVKEKQLDTADYILSQNIAVERKTIPDFLNSLIDGRLFRQIESLTNTYSKPLLILEGNLELLFNMRNIHPNALRGALASILLIYHLPILFSSGPKETAEYLYIIAKKEQFLLSSPPSLRLSKKPLSLPQQQQYIVEGFPGIGPQAAKSLLSSLGSLKAIFEAEPKNLEKADLIGKKKAKEIYDLIRKPYKPDINDKKS